jgi:hypothetical protein
MSQSPLPQIKANLITVLERLLEDLNGEIDGLLAWEYAEAVDSFLNEFNDADFFGTEGQGDPRGDFREGNWSILKDIQK